MMVDSGTTSHMTAEYARVSNQHECSITIRLADESTTTAHRVRVHTVNWQVQSVPIEVSLPETFVARDIKTSLLSVPAFVENDIEALFLPGKSVFLDLLRNNKIIGYEKQRP